MQAAPTRPTAQLPEPSADAQAHSDRVREAIVARITAANGWIPLADYIQAALYAHGLGYYVAGARKFGEDGDFVTAPEISPLFGAALAVQVAQVLRTTGGDVIELGAGSGALAADLLGALVQRDCLPDRYLILEPGAELRERQRAGLAQRVPDALARVRWIDALPPSWRGVVIANEVLDAVPPHVVVRRDGRWLERGVTLKEGMLTLADRPLHDAALMALAGAAFPPDIDYASEMNPAAAALVKSLALACVAGVMLLLDYGFVAGEYYHPQRSQGTLMTHYRHRALADPLLWPGLADITSHVDFSAIAHAGVEGGMRVAGFASQAHVLVDCGILDRLAAVGDPASPAYIRAVSAVQKLLSPAEMGELFKVLALARRVDAPLVGFATGDRSHRL
jgi:SAM-dependent MidA family methyltransferase